MLRCLLGNAQSPTFWLTVNGCVLKSSVTMLYRTEEKRRYLVSGSSNCDVTKILRYSEISEFLKKGKELNVGIVVFIFICIF